MRPGLRHYPDPAASVDPRVRLVVAGLGGLPAARVGARHEFKAELRQQLVAVTPRLVAEQLDEAEPAPVRLIRRPAKRTATTTVNDEADRAHGRRHRRLAYSLVTAAAVVVAGFGGAVVLSGSALPGDPLYGLKRASESLQLDLTSGNTARGKEYLHLASVRADEISKLIQRSEATALGGGPSAAGTISAHTASLIASTLSSENSDTANGTNLLTTQAARSHSSAPLSYLLTWAPTQETKLTQISNALPPGTLRNQVLSSRAVTQQVSQRAVALTPDVSSPCLANAPTDSLGPLPMTTCPSSPSSTGTPPTGGGVAPLPVQQNETSGAPTGTASGSASTAGTGSNEATGGTDQPTGSATTTKPIIPLPTIPLPSIPIPSLPIPSLGGGTNTCGIEITIPPLITISLGPCH